MDNIAAGSGNGLRRQNIMDVYNRREVRLRTYDYSSIGAYFITMCTQNRQNIFWNDSELEYKYVGDGVLDVPYQPTESLNYNEDLFNIPLSDYGIIVQETIKEIGSVYTHIKFDKYVIMPNHVHMILIVFNNQNGTSRTPSPTNAIIPSVISTFKRFTNKRCGMLLWQRSYYDHIIRNQLDYERIWQYIDDNPAKWELDRYYMEGEIQ